MLLVYAAAFKAALAEADYQRREYIRVKEGEKDFYHKHIKHQAPLSEDELDPLSHYVISCNYFCILPPDKVDKGNNWYQ